MPSPDPDARDSLVGVAALQAYRTAGRLAGPAAGLVLDWRARRGKEDPARRGERLGIAGAPRPAGGLVWLHAASVGETVTVLPLIERLVAEDLSVLLTTGTVTSAEIAARQLPAGAIHQFAPVDMPQYVQRFLRHWRPDLAVFVESELWPAALEELRRSAVPLVLVNARLSEQSFRKWRRLAPLAAALMRRVRSCLAQSQDDADRLRRLGAADVVVCGNLKFDAPPPPADEAELRQLRLELAGRPVLLAASSHPGEEDAVLHAHRTARDKGVDLVTLIAPRHPERGAPLAEDAVRSGFRVSLRSSGGRIRPETEIYVADTVGEMGLWYRMADIVILGGSLVPHGGQNPIEPAKLGAPILHGPNVANFADVYSALAEAGGARGFTDPQALATAVVELLRAPAERRRLAAAAAKCVAGFTGALDRTMMQLQPHLARIRNGNDAA